MLAFVFFLYIRVFIYLFQWISSLNPWLSIFPFPGNSGYLRLTICMHTLAVKLWVALAKAGEFWLVDEISSIKPAFPNHAAANTKISDQMPKNELSSFLFFLFLFYILPSAKYKTFAAIAIGHFAKRLSRLFLRTDLSSSFKVLLLFFFLIRYTAWKSVQSAAPSVAKLFCTETQYRIRYAQIHLYTERERGAWMETRNIC